MLCFPTRADEDLGAFNSNVVAADTIASSVRPLSVPNIERQIVPGARYDEPFDPAFAQGTAFMGTKVMDGKKFSVHVEECDRAIVQHDHFRLSGRHVINLCYHVETFECHGSSFLSALSYDETSILTPITHMRSVYFNSPPTASPCRCIKPAWVWIK